MAKILVNCIAFLCIVVPGVSAAYTLEDSKSVDEARTKMGLPDVASTAADSLQDNGNRTVSDSETIGEEAENAEKDAEAYYNTHKDEFKEGGQVKISHIMGKTKKEANDILNRLHEGESFEKLAKKYSIGPTASKGGELGFIGKGTVVQEFEDAAFKLKRAGDISPIVKAGEGYHIIKLLERKDGETQPFEKVKDKIIASQTEKEAARREKEAAEKEDLTMKKLNQARTTFQRIVVEILGEIENKGIKFKRFPPGTCESFGYGYKRITNFLCKGGERLTTSLTGYNAGERKTEMILWFPIEDDKSIGAKLGCTLEAGSGEDSSCDIALDIGYNLPVGSFKLLGDIKELTNQKGNLKKEIIEAIAILRPKVSTPGHRTDNFNGTVTDSKTHFMWQQGEGGEMNWDSAIAYCNNLPLAGYNDWRLPDTEELQSIIYVGKKPAKNKTKFPHTDDDERYWSSTSTAYGASVVAFYDGISYAYNKADLFYVRCVRGGQ